MKTPPDDMMVTVRRDLASWHATHPDATFADLETVVEEQIRRLRGALLEERTEAVPIRRSYVGLRCRLKHLDAESRHANGSE
jgi:hypothetical protein